MAQGETHRRRTVKETGAIVTGTATTVADVSGKGTKEGKDIRRSTGMGIGIRKGIGIVTSGTAIDEREMDDGTTTATDPIDEKAQGEETSRSVPQTIWISPSPLQRFLHNYMYM